MDYEIMDQDPSDIQAYREGFPAVYTKTASGGWLASFKLIEALSAIASIAGMVLSTAAINLFLTAVGNEFLSYLQMDYTISAGLSGLINFILGLSTAAIMLILAIPLVFMVIDGIGAFRIRFGNGGEGMVRFVHTVRMFCSLAAIISTLVGVVIFIVRNSSDAELIIPYSILAVLSLLVLFFDFRYNRDIVSIMKTISEERMTGRMSDVKKNGLGRKAMLLIILWIPTAILAVLGLFGSILSPSTAAGEGGRAITSGISSLISVAALLFQFLKMIFLRKFAVNFNRSHNN